MVLRTNVPLMMILLLLKIPHLILLFKYEIDLCSVDKIIKTKYCNILKNETTSSYIIKWQNSMNKVHLNFVRNNLEIKSSFLSKFCKISDLFSERNPGILKESCFETLERIFDTEKCKNEISWNIYCENLMCKKTFKHISIKTIQKCNKYEIIKYKSILLP